MDLSNITDREDWDYYSPYNNIISIIAICKIGPVTLTWNLMESNIFYIFILGTFFLSQEIDPLMFNRDIYFVSIIEYPI